MILGTFFDGRTSDAKSVEVQFGSDTIRILGLEDVLEVPLSSVSVSEALGRTDRSILLDDGARIDLPDSPELDRIGQCERTFRLAHELERQWKYALLAVVLVIAATWVIVTIGLPMAAKYVSAAVPSELDETIGNQGLALLDRVLFEPTGLATELQSDIHELFAPIVEYARDDHQFRLEFRSGESVGANAFALPSGIVIITDELVELAQHPDEIVGVLAHEVGHVVNRHSMRLLLQSSATAMLIAAFTGDIASLGSLAAGIPTMVVQSGYSRDFEREADGFAYGYLEHANIPATRLGDILNRLEESAGGSIEGALGYLSTHPPASERSEGVTD